MTEAILLLLFALSIAFALYFGHRLDQEKTHER
jgi:hypothetical protein